MEKTKGMNISKFSCDFSKSKYTTKQIHDLLEKNKETLNNAFLVDLSDNNAQYFELKDKSIEVVKASNNLLSEVSLSLHNLTHLDLSFNKFHEIPKLNSVPNLKVLKMNNNSITKLHFLTFKDNYAFTLINLSHNQIVFEEVRQFKDVIEGFARNFRDLSNFNICYNPFTINFIYRAKYYDYIASKIPSLHNLNGVQLIKEDLYEKTLSKAEALLEEMQELEKESKSVQTDLSRICDQLEIYSLDELNFEKNFNEILNRLQVYVVNISEQIKARGEEYIDDDVETESFERLINQCKLVNEKIAGMDRRFLEIFCFLSTVRRGKWADLCFSFMRHLTDSDDTLQRIADEMIVEIHSDLFSQLGSLTSETKVGGYDKGGTLEEELQKMPLIVRAVPQFIDVNFPNTVTFFYSKLIYLYTTDFLHASKLEFILEGKIPDTKDYEKMVKYKFLEYSIKVFKQALDDSCIKYIESTVESSHFEKLISITQKLFTLYTQMNRLDNNYSYSDSESDFPINILDDSLFILLQFNNKFANIINELIHGEYKIFMEDLAKSLYKFYQNKSYLLFSDGKLLESQEIKEKVMRNQIMKRVFKLHLSLIKLFPDISGRSLHNIVGMIKNIYNFQEMNIRAYKLSPAESRKENNNNYIRFEYDPFMLEMTSEIVLTLMKDYKFYWNNDLDSYHSFLIEIKKTLINLLSFLDESSIEFLQASRIAYIYTNYQEGTEFVVKNEGIENTYIIKLTQIILDLLELFGRQANEETDENLKKEFKNINMKLNENKRDDFLIKKLSFPNDIIKSKAMICFLNVDFEEISTKELSLLLDTIQHSNWLEGGMENIIDDTFFFIMKLYHYKFEIQDPLPLQNAHVIGIALNILDKNTERLNYKLKDEQNIRDLNISIITLLINFSAYSSFINSFKRDHVPYIKRILQHEIKGYDKSPFFPFNIEKCQVMWNIENLTMLFEGSNALQPYNYVSLRILMHIADLLMNIPYPTFDVYSAENEDYKNNILFKLSHDEYERIQLESKTIKQYSIFIEKKVKHYYKINRINPFIKLTDSTFQESQSRFVEKFNFFLDWLLGQAQKTIETSELTSIFEKQKFDPNLMKLDKLQFFREEEDNLSEVIKLFQMEKQKSDVNSFTLFVLRGKDEKTTTQIDYDLYSHIQQDLEINDTYPDPDCKRVPETETVHNPRLRTLFVSVFLRAILAVLKPEYVHENKENPQAQKKLLTFLRQPDNFQKLVLLIDTTKLYTHNICVKFLKILRSIFDNIKPDSNNIESLQKVLLLSLMMLNKIKIIIKSENLSDSDESELINSLVKCCLTIGNELNFFPISIKMRMEYIQRIFSFDLVQYLIESSCKLMNQNERDLMNLNNKKPVDYSMRFIQILNILARFMAISPTYAYHVIETLYRKTFIENISIRKTFIQECTELHRTSLLLLYLQEKGQFNHDRFIFADECLYFDHVRHKIEVKFIIISLDHFIFYDFDANYLRKDFDFTKHINLNKKEKLIRLEIADILNVYFSALINRVFIVFKTGDQFSLLFKKTSKAMNFCQIIKSFDHTQDKTCEAADFTQDEDDYYNNNNYIKQTLANSKLISTENKETKFSSDTNGYKTYEEIRREYDQKVKLKQIKHENSKVKENPNILMTNLVTRTIEHIFNNTENINKKKIFLVSLEENTLCECFSVENRYIYNPKIVCFQNIQQREGEEMSSPSKTPLIKIFSENYEEIVKVEINEENLNGNQKSIGYLSSYTLSYCLELSTIKKVSFISHNIIQIKFSWKTLKMTFLDDYSYFGVRSIVLSFIKTKDFIKKEYLK